MKKILLMSVLFLFISRNGSDAYGYGYYYTPYNSYPLYTGMPGTWGNETESSLYLRPLNNAMIGPSAFGTGYPQSALSYSYGYYPEPKESGILKAVRYLSARGELEDQQESRQKYVETTSKLLNRIEQLEKKIDDLQKSIEEKNKEVK